MALRNVKHMERLCGKIQGMQLRGYPGWAEEWWLSHAGVREPALLESWIRDLRDHYTSGRRAGFPDYDGRPELLSAYGLFYFPQTFVRVQFPLLEAVTRGWKVPGLLRILDLGAGTGAASLGAAHLLSDQARVTAVEQSATALNLLRQLLSSRSMAADWTLKQGDFRNARLWDDLSYDLVLLSFSLNEVFSDEPASAILNWMRALMKQLDPGGILVILEPATREACERLEELRDFIANENRWSIWGPCLHSKACPLFRDRQYWCHEVRQWTAPTSLAFLNRHLYNEIQVLKFGFLMLGHHPPVMQYPASPDAFRLISPVTKAKGKYVASGCAADGLRHEYEWLRRHLDPAADKRLHQIERGEIVQGRVQSVGTAFRFVGSLQGTEEAK